MYKAFVRSHLDYCDIIYHISSTINPPPLPSFNPLMEKLERVQYHQLLLSLVHGRALIAPNSMKNKDRNPYLIGVWVDVFCKSIKL